MSWSKFTKRCGIAFFLSEVPLDPRGIGDEKQEFDTPEEAMKAAEVALKKGRFKRAVIWDGISGTWELCVDWTVHDI